MSEQTPESNISIWGDGNGAEDFPVLKAFQMYIDAEQAKSRKRMTYLSAVFGLVLFTVVAFFIFRLQTEGMRIQQLNDRLIEFAMNDRVARPQDASALAAKDKEILAMNERMMALQKQITDQQIASFEAQRKALADIEAARRAAPASAPVVKDTSAEDAAVKKQKAQLKKAAALLKAEKKKIAAEKERLRLEEVERQRRRLYPEYYARLDADKAEREAEATDAEINSEDEDQIDEDEAIEYFSDADEYEIPVEVKKDSPATKWHLPKD